MRHLTILLILFISCQQPTNKDSAEQPVAEELASSPYLTTVNADTIFNSKGFTIELESTLEEEHENELNSILRIKNGDELVFTDSIFSSAQELKFIDFNSDGEPDILVQNISDVRSNWTYNLYLVNSKTNSFTKVPDFSEIKNPKLNNRLIESYVSSGTNYYQFYELTDELEVFQHDILLYDDHSDSSNQVYMNTIDSLTQKRDI